MASEDEHSAPEEAEADAKWSHAFDDDDDFLPDEPTVPDTETKELDPSNFFGDDDDDGFLEDTDGAPQQPSAPELPLPITPVAPVTDRYAPTAPTPSPRPSIHQQPTNPYFPTMSTPIDHSQAPNMNLSNGHVSPYAMARDQQMAAMAKRAMPNQPELKKAQSFADKAKGGYSSPYDLPMDVVKPRKRASMQSLNRKDTFPSRPTAPSAPPSAPPRSISMQHPPPPPLAYTAPPAQMPHLPRTSSPLAQFEVSNSRLRPLTHQEPPTNLTIQTPPSSQQFIHGRLSSLPPTREVDEDEAAEGFSQGHSQKESNSSSQVYSGASQSLDEPSQTAPTTTTMAATYGLHVPEQTRFSYAPQARSAMTEHSHTYAPPKRSQTQSPSAVYGHGASFKPTEAIPRPSSAQNTVPPVREAYMPLPSLKTRPRRFSKEIDVLPPTDGTQLDPLQRWRGAPVLTWGFDGTLATSFPRNVPRYGMGQTQPTIVRSNGDVKTRHLRELLPLQQRLTKFPGPLKGKAKKKETVAWLAAGLEELKQSEVEDQSPFVVASSKSSTLSEERALLWRLLKIFIEHDGTLEGNQAVDQAVRDVLAPQPTQEDPLGIPSTTGVPINGLLQARTAQFQSDGVDEATMERMKASLMAGKREEAVWIAADKRLWGQALLIANTVSPELYRHVSREFIQKEVNAPGLGNKSLAALYAVLSGNHEESIDELVPVHAREGFQLVTDDATATGQGHEGLDQWRQTLALILSNRSANDVNAIKALGNLLARYGRTDAAHVCLLFARSVVHFSGLDDPTSDLVLMGSGSAQQAGQFGQDPEAILLSEVFEYGLSLASNSSVAYSASHLSAYKMEHATWLAEYGYSDKALQYCQSIMTAIDAQTKRSPYHHADLIAAVQDLTVRLRSVPKEGSSSWIPKPSMNKVSDSMWNRFNKFVAGDEGENNRQVSPKPGDESGPFGRVASGTPTISGSPSTTNMMDMFGTPNGPPNSQYGSLPPTTMQMSPPHTMASSRYAPVSSQPAIPPPSYAPGPILMRNGSYIDASVKAESSNPPVLGAPQAKPLYSSPYGNPQMSNLSREIANGRPSSSSSEQYQPPPSYLSHSNSAPMTRQSSYAPNPAAMQSRMASYAPEKTYAPQSNTTPQSEYTPQILYTPGETYSPKKPTNVAEPMASPEYAQPSFGYQPQVSSQYTPSDDTKNQSPTSEVAAPSGGGYEPPVSISTGYEPPSYGYEPPSYDPGAQDTGSGDDEAPKPKKKSFMDDDDDHTYFRPAQAKVPEVGDKSKAQKDQENAELFKKAAEEDAKRAEEERAAKIKKGWGLGGWFGGAAEKKDAPDATSSPNKPIRAKLGEKSSFYYDPNMKRWINKAGGADESSAPKATPPPPRAAPRSVSGTPPPPSFPNGTNSRPSTSSSAVGPGGLGLHDAAGRMSAPPGGLMRSATGMPTSIAPTSDPSSLSPANGLAPPLMMRSASNMSAGSAGPPSRPMTSMSNASSIDDLLGAAAPRKGGAAKAKKRGGRYVDVMAK